MSGSTNRTGTILVGIHASLLGDLLDVATGGARSDPESLADLAVAGAVHAQAGGHDRLLGEGQLLEILADVHGVLHDDLAVVATVCRGQTVYEREERVLNGGAIG